MAKEIEIFHDIFFKMYLYCMKVESSGKTVSTGPRKHLRQVFFHEQNGG